MSLSSVVSLGALRIQAQQRADLENSQHITVPEWNQYISASYKRLYNALVAAYGNDYYVQTPYQFTINGTQLYNLPSDFYKLLGVDLQYSASPTGWVTLKKFEFIDRNKYSWLNPLPISASTVQLWYIPEPTNLSFFPTITTTSSSTTITGLSDTTNIVAGMNIYAPNAIALGTTIVSVNTSAQTAVLSQAATSSITNAAAYCWNDATTLDGISGWEEFVILDAAIKAGVKEETDISGLKILRDELKMEIEGLAEGRDAGQATHVSDALSVNTPIIALGATNLKYRLLGNQIQFIPVGYDDYSDGFGGIGGYGSGY